ncbi:MAG: YkgJ family cysteine cluster protein [Acidobacteria bacterium]|nr:YkgJ family cysteine cluster protein [Acidobacteriota bacterium]
MRAELRILQNEIDARASATVEAQPFWPCRRGCDHCCRHLAGLPVVTPPEEELLREGIAALDEATRAGVAERFRVLGERPERPVVCPLLDEATGACLVYEQRPVACRTYGFYVERDRGLYCGTIEGAVAAGEYGDVVWGNQAGVEAKMAGWGRSRTLQFP